MDPNAVLQTIRDLAVLCLERSDQGRRFLEAGAIAELSATILDLDTWLSRGGFLPKDWER